MTTIHHIFTAPTEIIYPAMELIIKDDHEQRSWNDYSRFHYTIIDQSHHKYQELNLLSGANHDYYITGDRHNKIYYVDTADVVQFQNKKEGDFAECEYEYDHIIDSYLAIQGTKYCEKHTCRAIVKSTGLPCTKLAKKNNLCGIHTAKPKYEMDIVKVGDYFSEFCRMDATGYIVTAVNNNGKDIEMVRYPHINPDKPNQSITHLRWCKGGYWYDTELGRKYNKVCHYVHGVLKNRRDPHY